MTKQRMRNQEGERDIQVNSDVYAIGIAVVPERLVPVMRTALEEMQSNTWVPVPYSLARSLHDTLNLYIHQKLAYLKEAGQSLIALDQDAGTLDATPLGKMSLKKLADRIAKR